MSFAENLKKIRKEKGFSQEELAEIMNVSRQAVSKWEQGGGYPEVEKLLLLSSKLNISLDSLMSEEIAQNNNSENQKVTGTSNVLQGYVLRENEEGKEVSAIRFVWCQQWKLIVLGRTDHFFGMVCQP